MTEKPRPELSEALLERMLFERAGAGAPADLVAAIATVVESTNQRPSGLLPAGRGRFESTPRLLRFAAAAIIAAVAVGGALYAIGPSQPAAGIPTEAPSPSSSIVREGAGTWTLTGNMTTPRSGHTATLLPDGRVLMAGGFAASAELYDPNTGTWTATGNMATPRSGHTATLLPDGRVLVAGGQSGNVTTASAELYDPNTGTWTATGNMATPRSGHTATLLPDGRVLVAGGFDTSKPIGVGGSPEIVATAELYDPSSGTWTATGTMSTSRRDHTATLLPDGTVLVVGGYRNGTPGGDERGPEPLDTAERYHPLTGVWTATGSTDGPFAHQGATLLPDGKVLVEYGDFEHVSLYDPGSGTWTDIPFPDVGGFVTATLLGDGTVLTTFAVRDVELYDPATGSWAYMNSGSITFGAGATATLLHDGTVLVAGGDASAAAVYHPGSTR